MYKKIIKVSRDGGAKKYTNKGSRGNVRQGASLITFSHLHENEE